MARPALTRRLGQVPHAPSSIHPERARIRHPRPGAGVPHGAPRDLPEPEQLGRREDTRLQAGGAAAYAGP